jgi:uncharacterized protein (DUF1501 family)
MLNIGSFRTACCHGMSRRSFLRVGASTALALGLPGTAPAFVPVRAKSVIFVFLWGAPSHLDTFDPKPNAPLEYRGPFSAIQTKTPGLRFSELLPRLAARSDRFTLVRTHTNAKDGHPEGGTVALTGFPETPGPVRPNFGAIVGKARGRGAALPPFISLTRGIPQDSARRIEGHGGGTLGTAYDPFRLSCSERGEVEIPGLQLLDGLTPQRLQDRETLRSRLDAALRKSDARPIEAWNRQYQAGHSLLTKPEFRRAFDLSREPVSVRERYGQSSFGQSCLLARKMAEAGVPFIQVNYSQHPEAINPGFEFGWDTHIYNFEFLQDLHCPNLDRSLSALLDDLHERGLIEHTLVVCMGEFGRTPRISKRASRDHWIRCYPSLWAGAGLPAGRVIGESDRLGGDPKAGPIVTPLMVGTTIAELAGVDSEARASLGVLSGGSVIHELL